MKLAIQLVVITILTLAVRVLVAVAAENEKPQSTITVRIEGLRNDLGTVFVSVYDNKKTFKENQGAAMSGQASPSGRIAIIVLDKIAPGNYALSMIHDENNNKKLDTNWIGMPKEGFGFSKDAMGKFGPPDFDEAVLEVRPGTVTAVIRTKYL